MKTKEGLEYPQNYDFVVKLLARVLCGRSIDFIGVEIGKIAHVFSSDTVELAVRSGRIDVMIENQDGDIFHIEEQRNLKKSDLYRFAGYHFLDAEKYQKDEKKFTDIVIASGDVTKTKKIVTASGTYEPIIVDLSGRDGRKTLEQIKNAVKHGDTHQLMELIFVPLYGKKKKTQRSDLALEVIAYERELLKSEKLDIRFLAMTLIMANKIIEKDKLEELWEEIKMYNIDILDIAREKGEEEGIEKGKKEGIEEGKKEGIEEGSLMTSREMLVNALSERFSIVPFRISEEIGRIGSSHALKTLFPHVFRCKNIEEFENVLKQAA